MARGRQVKTEAETERRGCKPRVAGTHRKVEAQARTQILLAKP